MKNSSNRPKPNSGPMNSVAFARAARALSLEAREWGATVPTFRSPPRIAGARRSMVRRADGSVCVSVATRNRSAQSVIADMIEGIIVAGPVEPGSIGAMRDALWGSVDDQLRSLLAAVDPVPAGRAA